MSRRPSRRLTQSENPVVRLIGYAFYDWTREMSPLKRVAVWTGLFLQGAAIWAATVRSFGGRSAWLTGLGTNLAIIGTYLLGYGLTNATLTSELVRKTDLEADQAAARKIQETLIPATVASVPGYEIATYYRPYREVGGDYFDVIPLRANRTLIAIADVAGKGMAAALLSANIQALVRSRADDSVDLVDLAAEISAHVHAYTPVERYATAVFVVVDQDSGTLTYVNAGHNPPLVTGPDGTVDLGATGVPLGLLPECAYTAASARLPAGATLVLYTDGLTDAIDSTEPAEVVRRAVAGSPAAVVTALKALIQPTLGHDDVTLVVVQRGSAAGPRVLEP